MTDAKASQFAQALADFSLNLYREIGAANGESSNIFLSPMSVSFALAMTYAGAVGNTKKQLHRVLFGDWSTTHDDEVHSAYAEVMSLLNKGSELFKLHLANRLYVHEPNLGQLQPQFTNVLKEKYSSELQPLDLGKQGGEYARGVINGWVGQTTNGKIKELIASGVLTPSTRMVLVNAVYFKAEWRSMFCKSGTRQKPFYAGPNNQIKIAMMHIEDQRFRYNDNDQFELLGMPYKGEEVFMFVFLPRQRDGLAESEKWLSGKKFLEAIAGARQETIGLVAIPKFKLDETVGLVNILSTLGATDIFDQRTADFSGINGRRALVVSDVIHKAFIDVDEVGTEAAATTDLTGTHYCEKPPPPIAQFIADHPFLFAVVDTRSTSVLFVGRYFGKQQ